jgi:hypothetical protein
MWGVLLCGVVCAKHVPARHAKLGLGPRRHRPSLRPTQTPLSGLDLVDEFVIE